MTIQINHKNRLMYSFEFFIFVIVSIPLTILGQANVSNDRSNNRNKHITPYSISSFGDASMAMPAAGNLVILPYSQTNLTQLTIPPANLKQGEVLLRRRFSSTEYGLYIGIINPLSYKRLSAFRYPANFIFSQFVKTKIYTAVSDNPDADIENIYFDSDFFYLENVAKVFFQDSIWWEISMLDALPGRLSIISDPPGAQVFIDNDPAGFTPFFTGAILNPSAIIRLENKGYYIVENFIDLPPGTFVEKSYTLKKKLQFDDGSEIDFNAYTAENTESVTELDQRIEQITEQAKKLAMDSTSAIDMFENNYPVLAPKDQFETSTEFKARKQQYLSKRLSEINAIKTQYHSKITKIIEVIPQINRYKENLKNREYAKFFDGSLLKLSPYVADSGFFPATMIANESGFTFTFNGKLFIPREDAKDFYRKGTSSGKVHLTYKNWSINVLNGATRDNYYVLFLAMKLRFKELDYVLKGNFQFPQFIMESPEYAVFIREFNLKNMSTSEDSKGQKAATISSIKDRKSQQAITIHSPEGSTHECGEGYCKGNRICFDGKCVYPAENVTTPSINTGGCSGPEGCKGNRVCIDGKCVDPAENVTTPSINTGGCSGPEGCKGNRVCIDGRCVEPEHVDSQIIKGCSGPQDCKGGRTCKNGVCVDIEDGIYELTPKQ